MFVTKFLFILVKCRLFRINGVQYIFAKKKENLVDILIDRINSKLLLKYIKIF